MPSYSPHWFPQTTAPTSMDLASWSNTRHAQLCTGLAICSFSHASVLLFANCASVNCLYNRSNAKRLINVDSIVLICILSHFIFYIIYLFLKLKFLYLFILKILFFILFQYHQWFMKEWIWWKQSGKQLKGLKIKSNAFERQAINKLFRNNKSLKSKVEPSDWTGRVTRSKPDAMHRWSVYQKDNSGWIERRQLDL